jgi:hypothetical protein
MCRQWIVTMALVAGAAGCVTELGEPEDPALSSAATETLTSTPGRDRFGVRMIYPTRGREWYAKWSSHARTLTSGQQDPRDSEFHNRGRGNTFRINGDGTATSSGGVQRHYIRDPSGRKRWGDIELTFYAMRVREEADAPTRAGFTVEVRTGDGHSSDPSRQCHGAAYAATFRYWGGAGFGKELRHPLYADEGGPPNRNIWDGGEVPRNVWVGFKLVVRDLPSGGVKLELYRDMTDGRNGGRWEQVHSYVDRGGWGLSGYETICGQPADRVIRGAHPVVLIRNDQSTLRYKRMSVREIHATDGYEFVDIGRTTFRGDIDWLSDRGLAVPCNPPFDDWYCPGAPLRREEMAAFLAGARDLPAGTDVFVDDERSRYEREIQAIARARITHGCNPPANDRFCPYDTVTRGQMAAFLTRAFALPASSRDAFRDDDGSVFESSIDAIAAAGITLGCNPPANDRFCPDAPVTRGQIAAFLRRAMAR